MRLGHGRDESWFEKQIRGFSVLSLSFGIHLAVVIQVAFRSISVDGEERQSLQGRFQSASWQMGFAMKCQPGLVKIMELQRTLG